MTFAYSCLTFPQDYDAVSFLEARGYEISCLYDSIFRSLLFGVSSLFVSSGLCIMAACTVAGLEVKIHKMFEEGNKSCLFGVDRDGFRQKIVLYAPASVVLHAQLVAGCVYRLKPAPLKRGNSAIMSYSTVIPTVTLCDGSGFPAYPAPIGVEQINSSMFETYQDIRVTVSHDFGTRDYDTQRGKVVGRGLLCAGPGEEKFEIVLWGDKVSTDGLKKGVTVVFYDVWIKRNKSEQRPLDRMELSGSLSSFGYCKVDTLMDDVVLAFVRARSPARKRKLSELAGLVVASDADDTALRARLTQYAVPGFAVEIDSERGEAEAVDSGARREEVDEQFFPAA